MKLKLLVAAGLIGLVAAACNTGTSYNSGNQPASNDTGSTSGSTSTGSTQGKTVEIDMTGSGFAPASVTINKGDSLIFVNKDTKAHWPASDPHPIHTDYPGFDAKKGIQPGQSYTFQFERTGTFGFHDHLNPSIHGTVTIK